MTRVMMHVRTDSYKKRQAQKWASRRGITLTALVNLALSDYVARHPLPGFRDETELHTKLLEVEENV